MHSLETIILYHDKQSAIHNGLCQGNYIFHGCSLGIFAFSLQESGNGALSHSEAMTYTYSILLCIF